MYFFEAEGLEQVQTLAPIAANSSKKPKLTDAAACTSWH
jgi:hypothetical protein